MENAARSVSTLPPAERLKQYRTFAAEAEAMASNMPQCDMRVAFLKIAKDWNTLADELECTLVKA